MLNVLILAAGKGKRMKSSLQKPFHKVGGLELIYHLTHLAESLKASSIAAVVAPSCPELKEANITLYTQDIPQGTGHAVMCANPWIQSISGDVLILCGDAPLIQKKTLEDLIEKKASEKADLAYLVADIKRPNHYGRLILNTQGYVDRIVEAKDLKTPEEKNSTLCNSGILLASVSILPELLAEITNKNISQEYYLTSILEPAQKKGLKTIYSLAPEEEIQGINSQAELARAEKNFQNIMRAAAMEKGVRLVAPETVFFSYDTQIATDTLIEPNVVFGPGVKISEKCLIRAFSHLEGCRLEKDVQVGPFARVRPGTHLKESTKVGNFVELKNTLLHTGSKVNHLSYCGDSVINENSNIGAGTITCNYDGARKHQTKIGKNCFIGSNTSLVAPIEIGDDVVVAAGSTLTQNVPAGDLALARSPQKNLPGKGKVFQEKNKKSKS
jgi:bifunctional UDP-N-acetylglucosamine pyrophosphorylase/glucosamine-1-phosphate N-acetyltransferase